LICRLLLDDLRNERFSVISFYERRIRRILPAFFVVIWVVVILGVIMLFPDYLLYLSRSVIPATFFYANFYFQKQSISYFASNVDDNPLLHTWSLSIEEQFYVFFPLLLCIAWRISPKRFMYFLIIGALLSLGYSEWLLGHSADQAFYFLSSRSWELLLGAIFATGVIPELKNRSVREAAGLAGIASIGCAVFMFSPRTPFPGIHALVPALGTALLIHSGGTGQTFARYLLERKPLVLVGKISYSLYLWHWPLLTLTRLWQERPLSVTQSSLIVALSFILAAFSWRYVEQPFRLQKATTVLTSSSQTNKTFALGALASTASLIVALAISYGWQERPTNDTQSFLIAALSFILAALSWRYAAISAQQRPGTLSSFSRAKMFALTALALTVTFTVALALYRSHGWPSRYPMEVRKILDSTKWVDVCKLDAEKNGECLLGKPLKANESPKAVLWGDSHANTLAAGLGEIASRENWSLAIFPTTCTPILNYGSERCRGVNSRMMSWLDANPAVSTIVVSSRFLGFEGANMKWALGLEPDSHLSDDDFRNFIGRLRGTIKHLVQLRKRVVLSDPVPEIGQDIPRMLSRAILDKKNPEDVTYSYDAYYRQNKLILDLFDEFDGSPGVVRVHVGQKLCPEARCRFFLNGQLLYRDSNHLTLAGSRIVAPLFAAAIDDPQAEAH
jgi:peptidoglycan/LPS O-acetylase OafA/YrhL